MPAFIRTKSDEHRWSRAKKAVEESRKKGESSFEDQDWALVNSIYHKMHKSDIAEALLEKLSKAPDEDDNEDEDYDIQDHGDPNKDENYDLENELADQGFSTIDPSEEGGDPADAWLAANDPQRSKAAPEAQEEPEEATSEKAQEVRPSSPSGYTDWTPRSDYSPEESAKIKEFTDQGYSPREAERMAGAHKGPSNFQDALRHTVRPSQMSPKMMQELKELAGHWLQGADRHAKLNADPEKNPMKHAAGKIMQAHENATKNYADAYNAFLNSDDVKGLKGMDRVKAIQAWKKDWKDKNPEYNKGLTQIGTQAKEHGSAALERHKGGVDERMQHVMTGGAHDPSATFTAAEAAQHVGGEKTDEGYQSRTIADPAASFAQQNKAALDKLRGMKLKPEQQERLKYTDSARAMLNVGKPTVIRRPGGGKT